MDHSSQHLWPSFGWIGSQQGGAEEDTFDCMLSSGILIVYMHDSDTIVRYHCDMTHGGMIHGSCGNLMVLTSVCHRFLQKR